ncbi:MAG: helix-turn-helix protein [Oscillospiraceae bacterium]|nr:helix-turn-helix protein [Oscillospiraceae bacterium]
MSLGQKIKAARLERGLTQKELVGDYITRNMLSKIENDAATPSVRTLEYLAKALDLPTGYFLSGAEVSDGSSPDGLDEARQAYREGRWRHCLTLIKADKKAGTTDEGCLLHARAGAYAAREALEAGDAAAARELAETAQYYNHEGMYYSHSLAAQLALTLGKALILLGEEGISAQRELLLKALKELEEG